MTVMEGWIPASLRAGPVDEKILVNVSEERIDGDVDRVVSNSFAFGGSNISLVLERCYDY
jgi:3-oxoacyl-(acyl-carrier-protein) synthase